MYMLQLLGAISVKHSLPCPKGPGKVQDSLQESAGYVHCVLCLSGKACLKQASPAVHSP